MKPFDTYMICTAPRSGSTLLCRMLAATGVAGRPESYFFGTSLEGWLEDLDIEPDGLAGEIEIVSAALDAARREGRAGTDLLGLRMQGHSFGFFLDKLASVHPGHESARERIEAAFGSTLFIHLSRGDKVGQAVSYLRAQETGLWHAAPDGTEIERNEPRRKPGYDRDAIRTTIAEMTGQDRAWDAWFADQGIEPLRLTYEDLSADPSSVLHTVLGALGVGQTGIDELAPPLRKLADETNASWVARFLAEEGLD